MISNDTELRRPDEHRGKHSDAAPGGSNPATVVVADDDDAFRETLLIWLSAKQCTTREASNGEEALDNLDDAVDVLVLDRRMPKLSGPEVVERLSKTPFGGSTIVLSAEGPDGRLNEEEVEMYLTKPINRDTFLERVEKCLR